MERRRRFERGAKRVSLAPKKHGDLEDGLKRSGVDYSTQQQSENAQGPFPTLCSSYQAQGLVLSAANEEATLRSSFHRHFLFLLRRLQEDSAAEESQYGQCQA